MSEEKSKDMLSGATNQLKRLDDLCDSQQREIDNLRTTNEKISDNLDTQVRSY